MGEGIFFGVDGQLESTGHSYEMNPVTDTEGLLAHPTVEGSGALNGSELAASIGYQTKGGFYLSGSGFIGLDQYRISNANNPYAGRDLNFAAKKLGFGADAGYRFLDGTLTGAFVQGGARIGWEELGSSSGELWSYKGDSGEIMTPYFHPYDLSQDEQYNLQHPRVRMELQLKAGYDIAQYIPGNEGRLSVAPYIGFGLTPVNAHLYQSRDVNRGGDLVQQDMYNEDQLYSTVLDAKGIQPAFLFGVQIQLSPKKKAEPAAAPAPAPAAPARNLDGIQ